MVGKNKAYFMHLLVSIIFILLLAIIVFWVWYPSPFASMLLPIPQFVGVIGSVIVIFPALTAFVYKPNKRTLKIDLTIIVILQLCCLVLGSWMLAQSRPAWMVLHGNKYHIVRPMEIREIANIPYHMPLTEQPWAGPAYTSLVTLTDPSAIKRRQEANFYGSAAFYPIDYQPITTEDIQASVRPLDKLYDQDLYQRIISIYPNAHDYIPVLGIDGQETAMVLYDDAYTLIDVMVVDVKEQSETR